MVRGIIRNLVVISLITAALILGLYLFVPKTPLSDSFFFVELRFLRGYPWLPALLLSVGVVAVSALLGLSDKLIEWTKDDTIPNFIRLILKILMVADPKTLHRRVWWFSVIGSMALIVLLWLFPRCITRNDILVTFSFKKGNDLVAFLSAGETAVIKQGGKYQLGVNVGSVVDRVALPDLKCTWSTDIFQDDVLIPPSGCNVEYTSGEDPIPDPVSLRLFQRRCSCLGSYSFFVQGEQK